MEVDSLVSAKNIYYCGCGLTGDRQTLRARGTYYWYQFSFRMFTIAIIHIFH